MKAQQSGLEKGAELALGVAHLLAKEEALNQSSSQANFAKKAKNPNDWKYIPAPRKDEITGITGLTEVKRKTSIQGGGKLRNRWKDREGYIYEWDSQHGTLEKYNHKGKHLGEFNYKTGKQTKSADPTRRIEP
ncbi:colicin E3/pyocin S6 family cytotoxin [Histophilus somni]|uniref:colicin E3/pyocin S6 family cytotoxin n=1 Tax=Histophilus somni TaxID=731 RepID=UPI00201F563D|nr:colicin E3/pyocin S6 family cytotoxin [Histophilus somni]